MRTIYCLKFSIIHFGAFNDRLFGSFLSRRKINANLGLLSCANQTDNLKISPISLLNWGDEQLMRPLRGFCMNLLGGRNKYYPMRMVMKRKSEMICSVPSAHIISASSVLHNIARTICVSYPRFKHLSGRCASIAAASEKKKTKSSHSLICIQKKNFRPK